MGMTGFRVMALGLALALSTISTGALGSDKEEAKERFEKGVVLFKDGNYSAALVEFRAAYAAMPHYSVRYNLGVTLQNLHRYAEAKEEFLAFLAEGGDDIEKKKRKEVEGFLGELESLVSTLRISCDVDGAQLFLNATFEKDLSLENEILLDVGEYDVEVRLSGYPSHYEKLEVPGGKVIELTVTFLEEPAVEPDEPVVDQPVAIIVPPLPPPPTPVVKKRSPAAFWTLLGLTVASGVTAGVLGGTFLAKKKTYEDDGPVEGWQDRRRELQNLAIGADLMIGVTAALTVATVVTGAITLKRGEKRSKITLTPTGTGLVLGGTF
jgi:hypothetical protein